MRITGGRSERLFDPGEMEEYIKRGAKRRKTGQEYALELQRAVDEAQMARRERAEVGTTRRLGITEAGLGERLGRTQEFAKPLQTSQIGYYGAGAESSRATAGLTRETADYARTVRPYKQEQERLKEKRAGLLTDIYERELDEPTGAFTNEYIMSLLSGKGKKPLSKRVYEDYLRIGY